MSFKDNENDILKALTDKFHSIIMEDQIKAIAAQMGITSPEGLKKFGDLVIQYNNDLHALISTEKQKNISEANVTVEVYEFDWSKENLRD